MYSLLIESVVEYVIEHKEATQEAASHLFLQNRTNTNQGLITRERFSLAGVSG